MTDHLEHYRRMARAIRFFPPKSLTHLSQESVAGPLTPAPVVTSSPKHTISETDVSPDQGPPIDPSEHVAALVHEAVRKPTVLPATYAILENIGDRISRLATPKPVESVIIQPKIPQPASNSASAHVSPALESPIDPEHAAALVHEAVSKPTVLPTSYTILENIGDRISRLTTPKPVDAAIIPPTIPQPDSESTSADTIEPQPIETDRKKSLDDTQLEASTSTTVVAEAPTVEESHSDDSIAVVVEPVAVEQTTDDEASPAVVVEPVAVEDTPSDDAVAVVAQAVEVEQTTDDKAEATVVAQSVEVEQTPEEQAAAAVVSEPVEAEETLEDQAATAVVAERVEVEETTDDTSDNNISADVAPEPVAVTETISDNISNTDAPVAEAEDAQAPTLLEKVSSLIEAVSTAFKQPEADQKDSETVVAASSPDSGVTEAPVVDTAEPLLSEAPEEEAENAQAPTLLEQVSSLVEAVSTAFKQPEADQKDSETVVAPSPLESTATEAPTADIVESLTTEAPASEVENTKASSLLERVSSVVKAVTTPLKDSESDKNNSEEVVEPEPAEAQQASDSNKVEVTCPKCQSTEIRKNGRRHNKQRYVCKDCGREFVMPSSALAEEKPKNKASSSVETSKVKGTGSDTVSGDPTSESSEPQSKKKTKAKGFGGSKKAK